MKDTLEGRAPRTTARPGPPNGFAAALRQSCPTAAQRERLQVLVAALRQAPPGSLESTAQRA